MPGAPAAGQADPGCTGEVAAEKPGAAAEPVGAGGALQSEALGEADALCGQW